MAALNTRRQEQLGFHFSQLAKSRGTFLDKHHASTRLAETSSSSSIQTHSAPLLVKPSSGGGGTVLMAHQLLFQHLNNHPLCLFLPPTWLHSVRILSPYKISHLNPSNSPETHIDTYTLAFSFDHSQSFIIQFQPVLPHCEVLIPLSTARMASREELDQKAQAGETVVPGGTGGKSLEAQEHLAEGRSKGGKTRANQLGHEGYAEMGKKGGLASNGADPDESAAAQDIDIDETKFTN